MITRDILDLAGGAPGLVFECPAGDRRAWLAADVKTADCLVVLDAAGRAEIAALIAVRATADARRGLPPRLTTLMTGVKARLDGFPGVAMVDGLPLDDMTEDEAAAAFWILGHAVGRPVAQKWDGTLLYCVRDTGQAYGPDVRGSATNVELVFHTDNAVGIVQPDYVGLLCLRPAREGGVSRFCSLVSVHERLRTRHPRALARLYRPLLWNRQGEHAPGAPEVACAPMFQTDGRNLRVRANASLVRKGYERAEIEMDGETAGALAALEAVTGDPDLWAELPLARGQMQYLNNRVLAHYRSRFVDHDDPAKKRHLIRTWHRDRGRPTYDG